MATASAGRAVKGASQAPARSARPCSATASRSAGRAGAKTIPGPLSRAPALKTRGPDMTGHDAEIEELRDKVHCAVVLERTPPPWRLDRKESTKLSLKYRRGKGEILIVSHAGRGVVGSDQRRQSRRLWTCAEARARPHLRPRPQATARICWTISELPTRRQILCGDGRIGPMIEASKSR